MNELSRKIAILDEVWSERAKAHARGELIYATDQLGKRKIMQDVPPSSAKRSRRFDDNGNTNDTRHGQGKPKQQLTDSRSDEAPRIPLTQTQIEAKLAGFASGMENLQGEMDLLEKNIIALKVQQAAVETAANHMNGEFQAMCIRKRNERVTTIIQDGHMRAWGKLSDQQNSDEVEPNLPPPPVFCISSLAWQELCGNVEPDLTRFVFKDREQTGIQALKKHCSKMSEKNRVSGFRNFLSRFKRELSSIKLWAQQELSEAVPEKVEAKRQQTQRVIDDAISRLRTEVAAAALWTTRDINDILNKVAKPGFDRAMWNASRSALEVSRKWARNRWQTYRAIARLEGGPFKNNRSVHDFNKDLSGPLEKPILPIWKGAIQEAIPNALEEHVKRLKDPQQRFQNRLYHALGTEDNRAAMVAIAENIRDWRSSCEDHVYKLDDLSNEVQKNASRDIKLGVKGKIMPAYDYCLRQSGRGIERRIRAAFAKHVENGGEQFHRPIIRGVEEKLRSIPVNYKEAMKTFNEQLVGDLRNDCMTAFVETRDGGYGLSGSARENRETLLSMVTEILERIQDMKRDGMFETKGGEDDCEVEYHGGNDDDDDDDDDDDEVEGYDGDLEYEFDLTAEELAECGM